MFYLVQFVLAFLASLPIIHWLRSNLSPTPKKTNNTKGDIEGRIAVLLPMRDEEEHVRRKILETTSELANAKDFKIILVDSFSSDQTSSIARKVFMDSNIGEENWEIITAEKPGKSHAINLAISSNVADFFVMMDADVVVESGWLRILFEYFSDPEVGAVSGMENSVSITTNNSRGGYRARSNKIRIWESKNDSTVVLEGAMIAWRDSAMPGFFLDENCNADDAQISLQAIRRGFRSLVIPELNFRDMNSNDNWNSRSIRRSQGLSRVLIKNLDLILHAPRIAARSSIFHSLVLYVIFPWAITILSLSFILQFLIINNWDETSLLIFFPIAGILLLLPITRSVAWGAIISIVAHIQYIFGKKYSDWNTERDFRNARIEKSD